MADAEFSHRVSFIASPSANQPMHNTDKLNLATGKHVISLARARANGMAKRASVRRARGVACMRRGAITIP
jgi:hypothetical protein